MSDLSITVDDKAIKAAFKVAPSKVVKGLTRWVNTTAALAERTAKDKLRSEVSEGASGQTINSIHILSGASKLGKAVKPTNKYAFWVHEGRQPGKFPPWGEDTALNQWAKRMGMNPFLVARHIAQYGTKGHPFMTEAYDEIKPVAEADADKTLDEIVRSI